MIGIIIIILIIALALLNEKFENNQNLEFQPINLDFLRATAPSITLNTKPQIGNIFKPDGLCQYPDQCPNQSSHKWGLGPTIKL